MTDFYFRDNSMPSCCFCCIFSQGMFRFLYSRILNLNQKIIVHVRRSWYAISLQGGSSQSTVFFFYSFQDNISHNSNTYYILSMISLVALVVCFLYFFWIFASNVESTPNFNSDTVYVQALVIAFSFGMGAIPWLMMSEVHYLVTDNMVWDISACQIPPVLSFQCKAVFFSFCIIITFGASTFVLQLRRMM